MESVKTVIITGASRGLGAATGRIAAAMGANVVLNARSAEALEQVALEIQDKGGSAIAVSGDIGEPDTAKKLVNVAVDQFNAIDAIINNAGTVLPIAAIADSDPAALTQGFRTNLFGVMFILKEATVWLRKASGRVINVSSGLADVALPGAGAYCAAKAALNQITKVFAQEEAGITSVAFNPAIVDTEMQRQIRTEGAKGMPAETHAMFVNWHENGALLAPEQPAKALAALALNAPLEMSGTVVMWDDEKVMSLVA